MAIIEADQGGPGSADQATAAARWSGPIRVIALLALVVAAFDIGNVSIPHHRAETVYWSEHHVSWAPIPAALAATALLVPRDALAHTAARLLALVTAVSLLLVGILFAIIGPVVAWRGATWYAAPTQFGRAFAVEPAVGVVSALGAVLIFGRVTEAEWPRRARDGLAGLGLAVWFASVPLAHHLDSWADWTSLGGADRLREVVESAGWTLMIFLAGMTVVAPIRFLRSGVGRVVSFLAVVLSIMGGVVLSSLGWGAAAVCVARENVADYFCWLPMPLIVASTVALTAGLALASRVATLEKA